ncbi:hypothetical protein ASF61_21990 [Duganella sp. Leaf126]|nr:hypothetical protein ASF61_21990 [Duganella sp. Leaf126]
MIALTVKATGQHPAGQIEQKRMTAQGRVCFHQVWPVSGLASGQSTFPCSAQWQSDWLSPWATLVDRCGSSTRRPRIRGFVFPV